MITGAKAMVEGLKEQGVDIIFGYPGATICPFYDELANDGSIQHILVRQEQNAGHMASGYARQSGYREDRRGIFDQRSRSDQSGYRYRHGVHGQHPCGRDYGTGSHCCSGKRRFPGSGYHGGLRAVRQTQLSGKRCYSDSPHHERSLSYRFHGKTGTGSDRCAERCSE